MSTRKSANDKNGDAEPKGRGGRPWSFDREAALDTAMTLFWQHGYEGVSIGDLTKAIGIAPPSLYSAFGSKAELYQQALDRYEANVGVLDVDAIRSAKTLPEAARAFLEGDVCFVTRNARGCMVTVGLVASHPAHAALSEDLKRRRGRIQARIAEALAPFGSAEEMNRVARHLLAVMQGLSVQAHDGASEEDLRDIIREVVEGLEARFG